MCSQSIIEIVIFIGGGFFTDGVGRDYAGNRLEFSL